MFLPLPSEPAVSSVSPHLLSPPTGRTHPAMPSCQGRQGAAWISPSREGVSHQASPHLSWANIALGPVACGSLCVLSPDGHFVGEGTVCVFVCPVLISVTGTQWALHKCSLKNFSPKLSSSVRDGVGNGLTG